MSETMGVFNAAPNARAIGESLENLLDVTVHQLYRRTRFADMHHQGTICIPTQRGWTPIDSRPDYAGLTMPNCPLGRGLHIEIDAKHCLDSRYRHSKKRLHQLSILWDVHQAGGIAGILVANLRIEAAWWLVPQVEWAREEFISTPLLAEGSPEAVVVPRADYGEFVPDWLTTALMLRAAEPS